MKILVTTTLITLGLLVVGCSSKPESGVSSSKKKGNPVILNESNFKESVLDTDKPVLVDFWAAWCGPCNMMSPIIEELAAEERFVVGKVNCDEEENLAKKYNISSIPAFLFFKDGELKSSMVGIQSKEKLLKALSDLEESDG